LVSTWTSASDRNNLSSLRARSPDYGLGSHTASLGLTFYDADAFPARYRGGAFIGQHGSWNRKPPRGYKVMFVPFADGRPAAPAEDILTGFLNGDGDAQGRPVGVTVDFQRRAPRRRRRRQRHLARYDRPISLCNYSIIF
jgi:glucose/arabinose dehydrogenase